MSLQENQAKINTKVDILEFVVKDVCFAVDIKNVTEIMNYQPVTFTPSDDPKIKGVIMPRDIASTVIDLQQALFQKDSKKEGFFIISEIEGKHFAFIIQDVIDIKQFSSNEIIKPPTMLQNENNLIKGIISDENRLASILDFKKIINGVPVNMSSLEDDLSKISKEK